MGETTGRLSYLGGCPGCLAGRLGFEFWDTFLLLDLYIGHSFFWLGLGILLCVSHNILRRIVYTALIVAFLPLSLRACFLNTTLS